MSTHGWIEIEYVHSGSVETFPIPPGPITVGKGSDNLVPIRDHFVGSQHAILRAGADGLTIRCQHHTGLVVRGAAVPYHGEAVLRPDDIVAMGNVFLRWRVPATTASAGFAEDIMLRKELERVVGKLHKAAIDQLHRRGGQPSRQDVETLVGTLFKQDELSPPAPVERLTVQRLLTDRLVDRVLKTPVADTDERLTSAVSHMVHTLKLQLRPNTLGDDLDLARQKGPQLAVDLTAAMPVGTRTALSRVHLVETVADLLLEYGPLTQFLRFPDLEEIAVVSPTDIYVARGGGMEYTGRSFSGDDAALAVLERIVLRGGRRIDRSQPLVDVRLADGSRVNAIIPPLALKGPCLTIRRFPTRWRTLDELVQGELLPPGAAAFLDAAVQARLSMVVSGGTASGKTTLLNALCGRIPIRERVITIEDTAELKLPDNNHVVTLQSCPPNTEGRGGFSMYDLVKNALRMRPDRIVAGEVRGKEAWDVLQAMSTGHDGSACTLHANSPIEAVQRLVAMMSGDGRDEKLVRFQIGHAVNLVIQIARLKNGQRRITSITELTGYDGRTDTVISQPIFQFNEGAGKLRYTGILPTTVERIVRRSGRRAEELFRWE